MAVEIPKTKYSGGKIREITLGTGDKAVTLGGQTAYNFHTFEGEHPRKIKVAFMVTDILPDDCPAALKEAWGDVMGDPAAWAKKAQDEFGADMIHLELIGTDPNGKDLGPDHAVDVVKKVAEAVDVPIVVWGTANSAKDTEVLRAVAEAVPDRRLGLGPVEEGDYKQVGASCLAYKHVAIASSPIDINLAKQLNILLTNLGVKDDDLMIDPTTGGLGYGLEYSFSVMERARQAALTQNDDKLQYPLYNNLGKEIWKVKEAKLTKDEEPTLGDETRRAVLMEALTAVTVMTAGSDVVVLRHPQSAKLVRWMSDQLQD